MLPKRLALPLSAPSEYPDVTVHGIIIGGGLSGK